MSFVAIKMIVSSKFCRTDLMAPIADDLKA